MARRTYSPTEIVALCDQALGNIEKHFAKRWEEKIQKTIDWNITLNKKWWRKLFNRMIPETREHALKILTTRTADMFDMPQNKWHEYHMDNAADPIASIALMANHKSELKNSVVTLTNDEWEHLSKWSVEYEQE